MRIPDVCKIFMPRRAMAATLCFTLIPAAQAAELNRRPPPSDAQEEAQRDDKAPRHDVIQGAHVEGHIAFLKAELGITPAQEDLWNTVAEAMREDVRTLNAAEDNAARQMHGPENAVQYLHNRAMFAQLRAEGEQRFLTAFQPLYSQLSAEQKRMADELLIPNEP